MAGMIPAEYISHGPRHHMQTYTTLTDFTDRYRDFIYNQQWYRVGQDRFNNKFLASDAAGHDLTAMSFDSDPRWKNVDFSCCTQEDYFVLCQRRAQQIARDYDHVRLWLSGGHDSYTVLRSFLDSGAKIDEIVVVQKYVQSPSELNNYEEHRTVRDVLQHHRWQLTDVPVTWLDYDWRDLDRHFGMIWARECFGHGNFEIRSGITLQNPYFDHPELADLFDQGLRVADVFGLEKPVIRQHQGHWFHVMLDAKFHFTIGRPGAVNFFCDPESPDLYVLDCHLTRQWQGTGSRVNSRTRWPHPCHNTVAHEYIRKYYEPKRLTMSEKSVAYELEASLHPQAHTIVARYYQSISDLQDLYPTLIAPDWVMTQGPRGHFGLVHSLERDFQCQYHELDSTWI